MIQGPFGVDRSGCFGKIILNQSRSDYICCPHNRKRVQTEAVFDNIAERIQEEIGKAKNSIYIAVAWFTNQQIFDALVSKAEELLPLLPWSKEFEKDKVILLFSF